MIYKENKKAISRLLKQSEATTMGALALVNQAMQEYRTSNAHSTHDKFVEEELGNLHKTHAELETAARDLQDAQEWLSKVKVYD